MNIKAASTIFHSIPQVNYIRVVIMVFMFSSVLPIRNPHFFRVLFLYTFYLLTFGDNFFFPGQFQNTPTYPVFSDQIFSITFSGIPRFPVPLTVVTVD